MPGPAPHARRRWTVSFAGIATDRLPKASVTSKFANGSCSGYIERANNKMDAEEAAATALIEVLKKEYMFQIDDMNFSEKTMNDHHKEKLKIESSYLQNKLEEQTTLTKHSKEGWKVLLNDMELAEESISNICGSALGTLSYELCRRYSHRYDSCNKLSA
ncbi:uncharacterized protein LOC112270637 isoform X2 [Brachypodium distachyon]|uniref:uncharacterized protein LOC112270637 isoform X2 n=1 Tax=Brachypodium distachyon TaxID=15368 RepID=UPI000D0D5A5A|nr:uncharacterized protein LOC112270637 isoform X2 [Brachypodium distachyon]|eukprot:XP_024314268.1 uncharacterized protein LOC112270637 isoform X2 [Brachypodium distachyon]